MTNRMLRVDSANVGELIARLQRNSIGGEDFLASFFGSPGSQAHPNYPPYNLIKVGDDSYKLSMAVAGFSKDEISVEVLDRTLTISGTKNHEEANSATEYLHQGLGLRNFSRDFKLVEYIEVESATLVDGMLTISLKRELPEAAKPKSIAIS